MTARDVEKEVKLQHAFAKLMKDYISSRNFRY
jgi:hypothetical protein